MSSPLRVLLCDDGTDFRVLFADVLRERGHTVYEVSAGAAAVACAVETLLDAAFIDIGLPDLSGFDVARRIRDLKLPARPRMIALTDPDSTNELVGGRPSGFDLWLLKPIKIEQVLASLELVRRLI